MKKCEMPSCPYDNETQGPFCTNCSASINRWSKRKVGDIMRRRDRLNLYSHRMTQIGPKKK